MSESRRSNVTSVRFARAIGDQVHAHLALGRLDGRVGVTGRHLVALGEQLKVVNQRLHGLLHLGTTRRHHLVIVGAHLAHGHLVQALLDDAQALSHLLHADQVAIVGVAVDADGHVELDLVVGVVRLTLAQVPLDARAAQHGAAEAQVERVLGRHDADADRARSPQAIRREQVFYFVQALTELADERVNVVHETDGQVVGDSARTNVSGVETRARHSLVELHHLLALLEQPEEGREGANVERVRTDHHQMVQQTSDLSKQSLKIKNFIPVLINRLKIE